MAAVVVERRLERRVVSVLFCDVVGSTAAAEVSDPEDVQARLGRFHRLVRGVVERFGGVVEKFVGDAVLAVFGAPVAHDDDAERAVRAGLGILESVADLDGEWVVRVRVGVNTGEAVVDLAARPEFGQAYVTGDVINTAARIQSAAPPDAVVVGEATWRATDRVFVYEPLEPVAAKGKATAVGLWRAVSARSRLGSDVIRSVSGPFVGRDLELAALVNAFDRCVRDASVQLVTVAAQPGIGKSRLVAELLSHVDGLAELVTWRQGRCLPYGDGVTFWALGEIVKAHAGILDTDAAEVAAEKLDGVLPDGDDRVWLRARLLPLVGVDTTAASREESFAAWTRFLESFTVDGPAVVVIEDLHWADPALLAFLEHLAEWVIGIPLLIVCTTRPELYDAHPTWGTATPNSSTVRLSRLSDTDTAQLIALLLDRAVLAADTQRAIVDRADGNPLFAEEFIRLLRDQGLLDDRGRLTADHVPVPDSVSAITAARLDTLDPGDKGLLANAAVVGKVFWAGAVAAMTQRPRGEVSGRLRALARKDFVRPTRDSTVAGDSEHAFWHAHIRDVAYAQLPRRDRATKHLAAADWIATHFADRIQDAAEILTHHTATAVELATATGNQQLAEQTTALLRRYAVLAADKAANLDNDQALILLDQALRVTPPDHPDHPEVLLRWGTVAYDAGRLTEAATALATAATAFEAAGNLEAALRALIPLSRVYGLVDPDLERANDHRIAVLLDRVPAGPAAVDALSVVAVGEFFSGRREDGLALADRAVAMATDLGTPGVQAYFARGMIRGANGDLAALDDLQRSRDMAVELGDSSGRTVAGGHMLAMTQWAAIGPATALSTYTDVAEFTAARHLRDWRDSVAASTIQPLIETGQLTTATAEAEAALPHLLASGNSKFLAEATAGLARARLEMGHPKAAEAAELAMTTAPPRGITWLEMRPIVILPAVMAGLRSGKPSSARTLLRQLATQDQPVDGTEYAPRLPGLIRAALELGDRPLAGALLDRLETGLAVSDHAAVTSSALLAQANGDHERAAELFADAAARWQAFTNYLEHAYALLGQARSLFALHHPDAAGVLQAARAAFTDMNGQLGIGYCDALLTHADTG